MAPTRTNEQNSSSDNPSFHLTLSATYTNSSTSPPATHQFSYPISAPIPPSGSTSVKDKTAYLCDLRKSAKRLQDEVNIFLTQKMEEDKLHAMKNGHDGQEKEAGTKTADEVEEENYGEEGVEDDEGG
jgi:Gon7 family